MSTPPVRRTYTRYMVIFAVIALYGLAYWFLFRPDLRFHMAGVYGPGTAIIPPGVTLPPTTGYQCFVVDTKMKGVEPSRGRRLASLVFSPCVWIEKRVRVTLAAA